MSKKISVPQIGESITSAFIASWKKAPGDYIAAGETLLEVDSDKASLEVPSPVSGVVVELMAEEGDEVLIGADIAVIDDTAKAPAEASAPPAEAAEAAPEPAAKAGPAVRQLARQSGVDLSTVMGSGNRGQILSQDVAAAAAPAPAVVAPVSAPAPVDNGALEERVKMSPLRRTIARRLVEAQQSAAMLTTFNEVDMSAAKAIRAQYQDRFVKRYGIKLGYMSFFVKAAVEALKEYPGVNAEIDGDEIIYKRYYNVGVAVSTPRGLMVPVIRDADRLSFAGVEQSIAELAVRARDGKLKMADFQNGTFTISNGGIFGSMLSTPILNPPQVGILGMHNIVERPVGVDGRIELRPIMYLALSYDHRIIDGREAVSFLKRVKELVEAPERILFEI